MESKRGCDLIGVDRLPHMLVVPDQRRIITQADLVDEDRAARPRVEGLGADSELIGADQIEQVEPGDGRDLNAVDEERAGAVTGDRGGGTGHHRFDDVLPRETLDDPGGVGPANVSNDPQAHPDIGAAPVDLDARPGAHPHRRHLEEGELIPVGHHQRVQVKVEPVSEIPPRQLLKGLERLKLRGVVKQELEPKMRAGEGR